MIVLMEGRLRPIFNCRGMPFALHIPDVLRNAGLLPPLKGGMGGLQLLTFHVVQCREAVAVLGIVPALEVGRALLGEGGARFH
jgi:hypothetical protein